MSERVAGDSDETEGRRLYRAKANALVALQDNLAKRRVRLAKPSTSIEGERK